MQSTIDLVRPRATFCAAALLCALVSALPGASAARPVQSPAEELKALEERIEDEHSAWLAVYRAAESEEARAELCAAFPRAELEAELTGLAERAKGTDVAARAWMLVYRLGLLTQERASVERAVERLVGEHLASAEIGALTLELTYGTPPWTVPLAEDALRKIVAGAKDESVQGFALAQLALLAGQDEALGDAGREEARALLSRVRADFGESDFIGMSGNEFAAGAAFELEQLRVGLTAPDFTASDQDGARFELSDYRGRVVLLDFWGFV